MAIELREVWFHASCTGSVDGYALKNLSNFHRVGTMPVMLQGKLWNFSSVEHAFHAAKYLCLKGSPRPDIASRFMVDGEYNFKTGNDLRKLGKKRGMVAITAEDKAAGRAVDEIVLDKARWDGGFSQEVMRACVQARAAVDPAFVKACKTLVERGIRIRHFARMVFYRSKSSGALVGTDALGPFLEEIGRQ